MSDSEKSNDDFKQWLDKFIQNNDIIEETEEERILNDLKRNLHTLYGDTLSEDVVTKYVDDLKQSTQSSLLQNDDSYSKKYDEILEKLSKGELMDKLLQSSSFNNPLYTRQGN